VVHISGISKYLFLFLAEFLSLILDMTKDSKITQNEGLDITDSVKRRRVTDIPQPLDYVSRELVGEFIENHRRPATPVKSFIKKLLKAD